MANPTIVVGQINGDELLKSIDKLVSDVESRVKKLETPFNTTIDNIKKKLGELGNASGNITINANVKGSQQQVKANNDVAMSYDKVASALKRAQGGGSGDSKIFATLDTELGILKERLTEAKQQVEAFRVMARGAGEKADKGLFVFATSNLHKYEEEVVRLSREIDVLTSKKKDLQQMLAPQGDTFKNYVNSLTKANPELALLNEQYRNGTSMLQTQNSVQQKITDEIKKQAEAIRQSAQFKEKGFSTVSSSTIEGRDYIVYANSKRSVEQQLLDIQKQESAELEKQQIEEQKKIAAQQQVTQSAQQILFIEQQITSEEQKRTSQPKTFATYENLRDAIAHVLQIQREEVVVANTETDSYNKLSQTLSQLTNTYNRLTSSERNSEQGKALVASIREVEDALRRIRQQQARPVNIKSILGLSENTLDDISYKIRQLQAYKGGINLTDPKQAGELNKVDAEIVRLNKDLNKYMEASKQAQKESTALTRALNYMKNRLAFYLTIGASTQFVKTLIDIRKEYEMNERALGVLVDSAERGTRIFQELSQMALVSPYTLIELSSAAKQLTAYDVAAKDVVDTTRRLADMAAAVGVPVDRLTYALGQIKAYGYLNARDARMFANAGIPLVKQLSDYYTQLEGRMVSVGDVYDRIKKKAIDYNDVMAVINKMTDEGGRFFDFQAKMADTLKVQFANLTLAYNNMLNDIGASNQAMITAPIKGLKTLFLHWKDINSIIQTLVVTFGIFKLAQFGYLVAATKVNAALSAQAVFGKRLITIFSSLNTSMKALFANPWTWVFAGIAAIVDFTMSVINARQETLKLNETIANNAKEAAKNLSEFLKLDTSVETRYDAFARKLSQTEGQKAWETIREEIEKSSDASNVFIKDLLAIEDINQRVATAFVLAEQIKDAQTKISDLYDEIQVSQDIWHGIFGEGIAEDLEDYQEMLEIVKELDKVRNNPRAGFWEQFGAGLSTLGAVFKESLGSDSKKEALKEIERFAYDASAVIKDILGKEGSKSPAMVNETIARIIKEFEAANPKIRGKAKVWFELRADEIFSEEFGNDVYDKSARLTEMVLEQIYKDSKSAFSGITDNILKETEHWNGAQLKAIQDAIDEVKNKVPKQFGQTLDELQGMIENREFKVNIMAKFGAKQLDNVQRWFTDTFLTPDSNAFSTKEYDKQSTELKQKYSRYMRKDNEDNVEYTKRMTDELEKQQKIIKASNGIIKKNESEEVVKDAEAAKRAAQAEIDAIKEIEKAGGYTFAKDKKGGGSKKDLLLEALKEEISLVEKLQGDYDKLRKKGASSDEALTSVTSAYGSTIGLLNKKLTGFGLPKLDISQIVGADPNKMLQFFNKLKGVLESKGLSNLERMKAVEGVIEKFTITAKEYNLEQVTKGLNNELSKLKDEYELAVELDANPELGDMFASMFGIDTSAFPKTIDKYMQKVQEKFDEVRLDPKLGLGDVGLDVFKATPEKWNEWAKSVGMSEEALKDFNTQFVNAQGVAKKWAQDTIKETQTLAYKLADNNGKIAIEEAKLAQLKQRLAKETNAEQKKLLELQIQDQQNAIAKLKEEILSTLPTYKNLFASVAEHSASMTRRLAKSYKEMLENAQNNTDGTYTVTDPISGGKATISAERYNKEFKNVNNELRKTQSSFAKIKESLTKGEDGLVDWSKGVELIAAEAQKLGSIISEIGSIAEQLGADESTVETIKDIATSVQGVATAAQGVSQIASGDYLGGTLSVIQGVWSAVSTWFDNSDKKITRQIEESQRAVERLQITLSSLQDTADNAYGAVTSGAQQAVIANKQLQLAELKRQLVLEQSRKSKNRDEERIIELQQNIKGLELEIHNASQNIINDLLGISSAGDGITSLVQSMIDAFRNGEDAMDAFSDSWDKMIDNMILKLLVSTYLQKGWDIVMKKLDDMEKEYTEKKAKRLEGEQEVLDIYENASLSYMKERMKNDPNSKYYGIYSWSVISDDEARKYQQELIEQQKKRVDERQEELDQASIDFTKESIDYMAGEGKDYMYQYAEMLKNSLGEWYGFGQDAESNLSSLQQGIQGITEDTAGALEAYMNSVSQQVYLQSDLLTQIRDAVIGFDLDVQVATMSQILLQLQSSYQVQVSIQNILNGVLTPSGRAFMVELNS